MKQRRRILYVLFLCLAWFPVLNAQETIPATGGSATGSGGTISYSVGQVTYNTYTGTNGSVAQGVQQPYEISIVTSIENTGLINLESSVYPNPTNGFMKLIVESTDYENLRFQLYDINGVTLQDKKVVGKETEIIMENLTSSVYFLKVFKNNLVVKVFKIVKK
jgi:hypothetical protein